MAGVSAIWAATVSFDLKVKSLGQSAQGCSRDVRDANRLWLDFSAALGVDSWLPK